MVPNGWREGKVKDLVKSLDAGVSVNSEDDGNINSEFKILKTSCVSTGMFRPKKAKSVVDSKEVARLKEPVKADSIIISRMNTPALVGANGYVETEILNSFLPDRLWQVKPRDNKVNMKWLGYWFSSSHTRYALSSTATGTSGSMKNITKPDVLNIKISIPPLPEQQKIAKILSTWDKAISTTERLIDNSTQQKKALMQQLMTGKKCLIDESGKRFEGEWEEIKLEDICIVNPRKPIMPEDGLVSFVPMDAVSEDAKLMRQEIKKYDDVSKGFTSFINEDVIVAKITPCFENGKGAFIDGLHNGIGFGSTEFHVLRAKENNHAKFIYYLSLTSEFRSKGKMNMQGSAGHKRVTTDYIRLYKFLVPLTYKEQQKIAAVLTNADQEIELFEQQLADLQQEKKALMQQLLTGKKRVLVEE
ncbi:restriction endonuclease subunit S [Psychrobacter sp. 72-O-c]|uniref:restriction endonuclease subunit S n=1 Tax=Psychrobacter sp. 72-O-c TaxID=2774125 RepID=UPI001919A114|nr:restriction endonuclease subunit S [Psychrobacter sp. 72-O-c]